MSSTESTPLSKLFRFVCKRCQYATDKKSSITKHLQNKYPCQPHVPQPEHLLPSQADLLAELMEAPTSRLVKEHTCQYCERPFKNRQGKFEHQKICKANPTRIAADLIKEQQAQIKALALQVQTFQRQRVPAKPAANAVVPCTIVAYGQEDRTVLTDSFLTKCLLKKQMSAMQYIKKLHFDKDMPEHHNVRYTNHKDSCMHFFNGTAWLVADAKKFVTKALADAFDAILEFYEEHEDDLQKSLTPKVFRELKQWINNADMGVPNEALNRDARLVMVNEYRLLHQKI